MLDIKIEEMSESGPPPVKRLKLVRKELEELTKEDLIERWLEQSQYVDHLEARRSEGQKDSLELVSLRESEEKLRQQQLEATRRENLLVMRLAAKEQEMQEYANQIQELKQAQTPGSSQLRATLLDPAVNLMFERMKKELNATKAKLEETQNELSAWKFTPDSNTGKRLMAKCRLLYQENEELGKMISSGRMAKLEGDLALQKNFSEEMKKSQAELDEFLLELDEDVEGMQSTIYYLQQQLKDAKEQITQLHSENERLQTINTPMLEGEAPSNPILIPAASITAVSSTVSIMTTGSQHDTSVGRDDIPTPPPSHLNGQSDEHEGYSGLNHSSQVLGHFTSQPPSPDSLDMNPELRGCVADISDTNVAAFTCVSPEMRLAVEEEEDEEIGEDCIMQDEQLRTYSTCKENSSRQRLEPVEETVITTGCEQSQSPWHSKIDGDNTRSVSSWTSSEKGIKESTEKLVVNGTSDATCLISDDDI